MLGVTEHTLTYDPEFKVNAVNENLERESPAEIFVENGFDLNILGKDIPI